MMKTALFLSLGLLTAACTQHPISAYANRGTPESLLDLSSEKISLGLATPGSYDTLVSWLNQEAPSRAELACSEGTPACEETRRVLEQFNVPYTLAQDARESVSLFYDRVQARNCENRYIDNSINPYNFNHPTFGCSVASNTVQMVTDKRQFVNPSLLDFADGEKTVQSYRKYIKGSPMKSDESGSNTSMMAIVPMGGTSQ